MDTPQHQPRADATTTFDRLSTTGAPASPRRRKRASTSLAAAVLDMAPEATVVTDRADTIRLVNRQTEALFGYSRRELLGQSVQVLIPAWQRMAYQRLWGTAEAKATHPQWRAAVDDHAAMRPPPLDLAVPVPVPLLVLGRRRDGYTFPVEVRVARLEQDGESLMIASVRETHDVEHTPGAKQEVYQEQVQRVLAVTDTALAHLELDALLPELLPRVRDVMAADFASIFLLDAGGQELTLRAESHLAQHGSDAVSMPMGVGLAGRVAASRQPLVVDDVASFPLARPHLRETIRSAMGVPLLTGDERLVGVLCVGTAQTQHFAPQDVALLEQAAVRISTAIERARLFAAEQAARRQAEQERARWHAAMESVPEFVITCDADLRMTYVNSAYARLRGGPADPLVSLEERPGHYGLFLPDGQRLFPPEQLPLTRAVREGQPVHGVQMLLRSPEGDERLVEWEAAPMSTAPGEVLGAVAIGHDITERRQLERKTQELVAQLEATFDAMADLVLLYDHMGRLLRINRAMQALLGITDPTDYTARTLAERGQPFAIRAPSGELLPADEYPIARALRGEMPTAAQPQELLITDAAGHEHALSFTGGPVLDATGTVLGYVTVGHDITKRIRLEREREQARAEAEQQAVQLAATFEAMADGVAVFDVQGQVVRANTAHRRLLGLEDAPPDFAELPLSERLELFAARDEQGRLLGPDEGPVPRAVRGEVVSGAETMDLRVRMLDGRKVELNVSAAPLRDREGHLMGAVAVFRDQTERKRLERQLAEQAEQLDRIFEGIADGVVVYDDLGQVVRANTAARRLLGLDAFPPQYFDWTPPERGPIRAVYDEHGRILPREAWPLLRALRGEVARAEGRDLRVYTLDGRKLELTISAAPLRDGVGRLVGAVTILHDETERKRLAREREEALAHELAAQELAQQLDQFFAMAAHDIRSPLTALSGSAQYARVRMQRFVAALQQEHGAVQDADLTTLTASLATALDLVQNSVQNLSHLVGKLFDVARARSGTLTLDLAVMDLAALVREQLAAQQLAAPGRRIELHAPDGPVTVVGDAVRLGQVLTNYLTNALKYSADDQPVIVRLTATDDVARVSVEDRGPGLSSEQQIHVWDLYHQVSGPPVRAGASAALEGHDVGLGLGLYIVKRLVELHPDGQVGVDSVVGRGSTFWYTLPLADSAQSR